MAGKISNSNSNVSDSGKVVDFIEVREKRLEEKRHNNERIFFHNLMSVFSITGGTKGHPIELIETSEDGLSFLIPVRAEQPWPIGTEEIPLRLYFSHDTYLEILVHIKNSRPSIENGRRYVRYGCLVDKQTQSYAVYLQFVKFLKLYAEQAHKDMGDISAFYR